MALFLFSSRASSVISTITRSVFSVIYVAVLLPSHPVYVTHPSRRSSVCCIDFYQGSHPSIHPHVTLMFYAISLPFHRACKYRTILVFSDSCGDDIIPSSNSSTLGHLLILTPSRSNSILLRRLTYISSFKDLSTYPGKSIMPSNSAVALTKYGTPEASKSVSTRIESDWCRRRTCVHAGHVLCLGS